MGQAAYGVIFDHNNNNNSHNKKILRSRSTFQIMQKILTVTQILHEAWINRAAVQTKNSVTTKKKQNYLYYIRVLLELHLASFAATRSSKGSAYQVTSGFKP